MEQFRTAGVLSGDGARELTSEELTLISGGMTEPPSGGGNADSRAAYWEHFRNSGGTPLHLDVPEMAVFSAGRATYHYVKDHAGDIALAVGIGWLMK